MARTLWRGQEARWQTPDNAFQRPGRNQPERIRAIHRQTDALEVLAHGHRVEYAPRAESGPIFNFYMGKNTPERKDYIMDKLVVPVEE